jgi:alpha-1,3-rhamnosyl/mannosyltransferase
MIKVGLGVTVLSNCIANSSVDGIGQYTKNLKEELCTQENIEVTPFSFKVPVPKSVADNNHVETLFPYAPSVLCSSTTLLPFIGSRKLRRSVDIIHATDHLIPNMGKTPVVATLMDAIPLSHPQWVSYKHRELKNFMWRRASRWATHIVTISEYSKMEIITHFGVKEENITAIPLAVDKKWFEVPSQKSINEVRTALKLPEKYYLCVGTIQPRKNIERVVAAHLTLPEAVRSQCPLVIVGRSGWGCEEIVNALTKEEYGDRIKWVRYVDDESLKVLTSCASALVFPSLYEGFGLPVLEAMAAGLPVITSNISSLPEVSGDAALLVDPFDSDLIATAMLKIVEDSLLADELSQKGIERAKLFTWEETALQTIAVYQKVLS